MTKEYKEIARFMKAVNRFPEYGPLLTVSFLSVIGAKSEVFRSRLSFDSVLMEAPPRIESPTIVAEQFLFSALGISLDVFMAQLLAGNLITPDGAIPFRIGKGDNAPAMSFTALHPDGLQNQNRFGILSVGGEEVFDEPDWQQTLDWELKAFSTPYNDLQEVMHLFRLGVVGDANARFDGVIYNVVAVDFSTTVSGETATVGVRLAPGFDTNHVTLGYRVLSQNQVFTRASINGGDMTWSVVEKDIRQGRATIEVPNAAVVQCFASYRGVAQSQGFIVDPSNAQNSRLSVYEVFDSNMEVLKEFLFRGPAKSRDARDLETGIAWLLWISGFSVAHLGGTAKTQAAADIIANTPSGHYVVIECTTGLLKADNKLPLLMDRVAQVRSKLQKSNSAHFKVLPVMVTSKTKEEVKADLEQAERLGILVMTKEDIEEVLQRAPVLTDAEQIFKLGEETVAAALAKYAPFVTQN